MTDVISVLHIDDNSTFVELAADMLEGKHDAFSVTTETTPEEGLQSLQDGEFDCVVCDYDMPGMDGIEVLESVREDFQDLPFILYTGKGSEEVASNAIAAGVTDYLQKSGGTEQYALLANRVENAVEQYRASKRAIKLERISTVLQDINQSLIGTADRADFAEQICTIITAFEPYVFAWIGQFDEHSKQVVPEAATSQGEEYLERIEISKNEDGLFQGPTGRAIETGEISVTQAIEDDPDYGPWRKAALSRGFRASAAIPLMFEGERFGVLNVYSDMPNAFDDAEIDLLQEIGDDIAHGFYRIKQQTRYRLLFEESVNGIAVHEIVTDAAGNPIDYVFRDVNPAFEEITGLGLEEIQGQRALSVLPDLGQEFIDKYGKVALEHETLRFQSYSEPLDDYFDVSAFPLGDDRFVTAFSVVTEARKQEQELKEMIDQMNDAIFVHRPNGDFLAINRAAIDIFGFSETELEEMGPVDLVSADDAAATRNRIDRILADGSLVFETTLESKQGTETPVEISSSRIEFRGDVAVLSIVRDISGRKQRERLIEQSEQRYRSLFESNPAVIWEEDFSAVMTYLDSLSAETEDIEAYLEEHPEAVEEMLDRITVIDVSRRGVERYGADSKADLIDNMDRLFTDEALQANKNLALGLIRGETHLRIPTVATTFDGRRIHEVMDVSVPEAYREDYSRIYITVTDITEQKRQSEHLRETKERLELALEAGQIGVWEWDIRTDEVVRDERWATILGYSPEEIPDTLESWEEKVHPDDLPDADSALTAHINGDSEYYESEHRLQTVSGDWKWVREVGVVKDRTDDGEPLRAMGVTVDIDDRKRAMRSLEEQTEQLDEFATVVSHDLRNPLNVVQGRLELALEECDSEHLAELTDSVERMDDIIENVLTIVSATDALQEQELASIPLRSIADSCWSTVDTKGMTLDITTDRAIRANHDRLTHIFENLYRNAVQHAGPDVTVEIGATPDGFYVEDDGPGIPEPDREQVFQSGYSTGDGGTGFGLTIVQKMVDAHDWDIEITHGSSGGTRVEITGVEWAS